MIKQFFGKQFACSLIAIACLNLAAIIAYYFGFDVFLISVIAFAAFGVAMATIEFGIGLALLELFSNAHGQLLSIEIAGFSVSLRMIIFAAVMLAFVLQLIQRRLQIKLNDKRLFIFIPIAVAILVGFMSGVLRNGFSAAFSDGNAYLYLLYLLPILSVQWTNEKKKMLLQILTAGAVWNILISLLTLYIFSHFGENVIYSSYVFLRDLRIAEITDLGGGFYRVFQQTQFFVVALLLLVLSLIGKQKKIPLLIWGLSSAALSVVLLSLSRSFWLGFVAALVSLAVLLFITLKPKLQVITKNVSRLIAFTLLGGLIIVAVTMFPVPNQNLNGSDLASAFSRRASASDDVAISSRWNLLEPMLETIKTYPIEGAGFGTAVTFTTDDPRAREINPSGEWSVVAMEWGWLEIWLKMGVIAPIGFVYLLFMLCKQLLAEKSEHQWISFGLVSGIVFLAVTHFFSPYLNHPIGLGFILFCIPFIPINQPKKATVEAFNTVEKLKSRSVPVVASKTNS